VLSFAAEPYIRPLQIILLLLLLLLLLSLSSSSSSLSSPCNLRNRVPCFGHVKRMPGNGWITNQRVHEGSECLKKGEWINEVRWNMTNHGLAEA
jgi:hypothetical protein